MAKKSAAKTGTVDDLLRKHSPQVKKWTKATRRLVLSAVPRAQQRVYLGWHVIAFCKGAQMKMNEMFVGVSPLKDSVGIYFAHGVDLPDPAGLLAGTGKGIRHAKIHSDADLKRPALKKLIQAAYRLTGK